MNDLRDLISSRNKVTFSVLFVIGRNSIFVAHLEELCVWIALRFRAANAHIYYLLVFSIDIRWRQIARLVIFK